MILYVISQLSMNTNNEMFPDTSVPCIPEIYIDFHIY